MLDSLAKGFFDLLFNLVRAFIQILFTPLQTLLPSIFTGIVISDYTQNFYSIINQYIIPSVSFFANMVPPMTWSMIIIYFDLMIAIYGVVFVLHYILKPLTIIKRVVPFT